MSTILFTGFTPQACNLSLNHFGEKLTFTSLITLAEYLRQVDLFLISKEQKSLLFKLLSSFNLSLPFLVLNSK